MFRTKVPPPTAKFLFEFHYSWQSHERSDCARAVLALALAPFPIVGAIVVPIFGTLMTHSSTQSDFRPAAATNVTRTSLAT